MKRRRVLVLAYLFPPLGGAGVQRTLKFVRYLEPLGWNATVVTTRSRHYPALDPSLLEEVPRSTRVIRTSVFPLARWLSLVPFRLRMKRLYAALTWPDGGSGWAFFAFLAALHEIRRQRPDVIFTTSAPYGAHLVGLGLARLTGIPWVADFRDEWATNPHLNSQPRALTRLATRAEFAITSTARRIVVAADYFRLAGLPAGDPRRRVIFNGVDERDLPTPRLVQSGEKFVLAHVGTLYESVDPSPVFRALAALAARNEIDGGRVQLRLVGSNWLPNFEPPRGLHVEQTGYVDHARALEEMGAATALLLYVPKSSLAPSGKLFEYLASGRPVLSCAHTDSLASRLVTEWDAGVTADPHDEAQIEQAILTLWQRWEEDGLPDQAEVRSRTLEHYSRQANSEQLAEVFEESLQ